MAAANKLEAVCAAIHDRVVAAGSSLSLAVEEGILEVNDTLSQAPSSYWVERIEGQAQGSTQFRGSRGGLVWRYLLAAASWECLLARVSLLFGPEARLVAVQMGRGYSDNRGAADAEQGRLLAAALRAEGFQAYVMERFGNERTFEAASQRIEKWLESPDIGDCSSIIDFLVDVFVQDAELADLCNLPRYLEADHGNATVPWLLEVISEEESASFGESGFHALAETLWDKRLAMREAMTSVLSTHEILRSLVLSRFLPYAECRFQLAEARRFASREVLKKSLPGSIVELACKERQQRDKSLASDVIHQDAGAVILEKRIRESLAWSSVPFLYWCVKAHLDIRPLWGDKFRHVQLWPRGLHWADQEICIAIASRLDRSSFVSACRALTRIRQNNSQATCVLVTDQWDEEHATAEYQAGGAGQHDRGIVVCRSDGVQRPVSFFRFPG